MPSAGGGASVVGCGSGGNFNNEDGGYVKATGAAEMLVEAIIGSPAQ